MKKSRFHLAHARFPRPAGRLAMLGLLAGLGGCLLAPSDKPPPLPVNARYSATSFPPTPGRRMNADVSGPESVLRSEQLVTNLDIPGAWWEVYRNPDLNRLVVMALTNSPSLKAMQRGLRVAWEQRRVEGAGLYPQVSAQLMPSWNKVSHDLSNVPIQNYWNYSMHTLQLQVGYVPDLWGGKAEAIIAAGAQADIQRFQLEATALTLISNLVNDVFMDAGLRSQIQVKKSLVTQADQILTIMNSQQALGETSVENTLLQRNVLDQQDSDLPPLEKQLAQNRDQIAILVGVPPSTPLPEFQLDQFTLPAQLPMTLPAQLLEQRPDVQAARAQITAAAAQVGIAIANRLPNLQLSASPGYIAEAMKNFFTPSMGNYTLMATVTQPLFQGGSLVHAQRAARQVFLQSVEEYKNTVLTAIGDVADSLHAIEHDSQTLVASEDGLEAAQKTYAIARAKNRLGDNSRIDVLAADFLVLLDRQSVIQDEVLRFTDTVALFQALGGGWWHRNDLGMSAKDAKRLSTSLLPW
ncbi:efflux transporter outer membrane subunit [Oecophyllibacter saccharovorans]|nr:efflux transporter outer membrane subunit [Oecophyllibacter saccharovorans]